MILFLPVKGCPGCSVKGVCYFPNQEWKQGCWTKKCSVYSNGFVQGWRTPVVKTRMFNALFLGLEKGPSFLISFIFPAHLSLFLK